MTIELALCIVIILLAAGAYQALASVDFKPLIIKLPERKVKVIQAEPVKVENYWQHWVDERVAHEKTVKRLEKAEKDKDTWYQAFESAIDDNDKVRCQFGLEPVGHNIKPKKIEFEDGMGNIFYRTSWTASNANMYVSQYLDGIEKMKVEISKPAVKMNPAIAKQVEDLQQVIKKTGWVPARKMGCKWCNDNYTCTSCQYEFYSEC